MTAVGVTAMPSRVPMVRTHVAAMAARVATAVVRPGVGAEVPPPQVLTRRFARSRLDRRVMSAGYEHPVNGSGPLVPASRVSRDRVDTGDHQNSDDESGPTARKHRRTYLFLDPTESGSVGISLSFPPA